MTLFRIPSNNVTPVKTAYHGNKTEKCKKSSFPKTKKTWLKEFGM